MRVIVSKKFRDKYTEKIHQVGDVIEVDENRLKEILSKGKLVDIVEDEADEQVADESIEVAAEIGEDTTDESTEVVDETEEEAADEVQELVTKKSKKSKK